MLLSRDDFKLMSPNHWEKKCFLEFEQTISSKLRPFPCVFGIKGFEDNQLRYICFEDISAKDLAIGLNEYISICRNLGSYTSLVVFEKPKEIESIEFYYHKFWSLLKELTSLDQTSWPMHIPKEVDTPLWEFCFAGEPIFVVCNTPAHVQRQSRRSSSFMMTFQPRWVFDDILGTEKSTNAAFSAVRSRLVNYDLISISPNLGKYGDPSVREWKQYFLEDDNMSLQTCPFHNFQ